MKFVVLISNGIDSPVATYLISKYAERLILVHASLYPFGDKKEKTYFLQLFNQLKKQIEHPITGYYLSHGASLSEYKSSCEPRFTCVFCKRMMLRYADSIAQKEHADALVTGDSLGQVASQTLQNMKIINQVSSLPVLRPLIGMDKEEIVAIAREIGTFSLSTIPQEPCTAVPSKPATQAKFEQIRSEEKRLDIDRLIKATLAQAECIE
jgi:thiamine biosynthesis protein ThiI